MVPLQLIVFMIAAVLTTVSRLIPTAFHRPVRQKHLHNLKILFCVSSGEDWNEILWEIMRNAFHPQQLRFGVLVECDSLRDAERDVDPLLRSITHVDFVLRKQNTPDKSVRRLSRHFVLGDESVVIIVDSGVRFRNSFDLAITKLLTHLDDDILVSVPCRCTNERGHFPCLMEGGGRNQSLPFFMDTDCLVSSVCVCHEVMLARPQVFRHWVNSSKARHFTTPLPLVLDDRNIETSYIARCCQGATEGTGRWSTVGIVDAADEQELILKFGSTRAGRLSVKFGHGAFRGGA